MDLPPGLTSRPATDADLRTVYRIASDAEVALTGRVDVSIEDIRADWARPNFDLATDSCLVLTGVEPIGYGEVFAGRGWVHVHPDHEGRGVGGALLGWTEQRGRAHGWERVGQTVHADNLAAVELFESRGYAPRWDAWVLEIPLDEAPPAPVLPAGLELRSMRRPDEDLAVYSVIDAAFSEWPDREPGEWPFEDWRAAMLDREDSDTDVTWVVVDGDRIIGAAVGLWFEDGDATDGWVQQLAVDRSHRGRGLGHALLNAAFATFRERGYRAAGLSTDSRTGALNLYQHVGMEVVSTYCRWSLDL